MSGRPWWEHVVWLALMGLVMGWLAKARRSASVEGRSRVLRHPPSTLIVGVVCTALFLAVGALSGLNVKPSEWWVPLVFFAFALLGVPLIVEGVRVRIELKDEGIAYRGLLRSYDSVPWNDIDVATWSPSMKWLVLTTRRGDKLRVSAMLNGLDALALALGERAPTLRMNDVTRQMLADARAGKLPNIWQ